MKTKAARDAAECYTNAILVGSFLADQVLKVIHCSVAAAVSTCLS